MNNNNYKFILADDHKGNKALVVIKGHLSNKLVDNAKTITDPRFNAIAGQLKKIIDSASVIETKGGDQSCN